MKKLIYLVALMLPLVTMSSFAFVHVSGGSVGGVNHAEVTAVNPDRIDHNNYGNYLYTGEEVDNPYYNNVNNNVYTTGPNTPQEVHRMLQP